MLRIGSYLYDKILNQDLFAKRIQLTYKSKKTLNTFIGGLISLVIKVGICLYLLSMLNVGVRKTDMKII